MGKELKKVESKVAVFAHFDRDNLIEPYVVYYLKELKKVVNRVIFVSDSDLNDSELKKLDGIVDKILAERHGEYDFGSYKRGYLYLKNNNLLENCSELILANDSCFGPLIPFRKIWARMKDKVCSANTTHSDNANCNNKAFNTNVTAYVGKNLDGNTGCKNKTCDFWGITQYTDRTTPFHIQSFFLVFRKQVFSSAVFDNFMKSIKQENTKMDVVRKYEIGLSQLLISEGFSPQVYSNHLMESACFSYLLYRSEIPFIKTMLVKNNFIWVSSYILKKLWKINRSAYNIDLILDYALKYKNQNSARKIKNLKRAIVRFTKGTIYLFGKEIKLV